MKTRDTNQNNSVVDVCSLLFQQVPEPSRLEMCKAINVYDNKYRINIYTRHHDPIYDIDRIRISQSYFARIDGSTLTIVSPKI